MLHLLTTLKKISLVVALFFSGLGYQYYQGEKSDHFDGKCFHNPNGKFHKSFPTYLKWKFTKGKTPKWPRWIENTFNDIPPKKFDSSDVRVTFVNHATILLQTYKLNIITDPI